jgi:hypothetical protein
MGKPFKPDASREIPANILRFYKVTLVYLQRVVRRVKI